MAVFFDITHLPEFKNAVLTIGTFDGVHQGHKAILNEVATHAQQIDGESVLLTFEPHPRKLLYPNQPLGIITPLYQKLVLIHEAGIKHIVVVPFTEVFAHQKAQTYIEEFLVAIFKPHSIVIGYDHHFGHDRLGNINLLKQFEKQYNYQVIEIPAQFIDDATISSTKIRHAIEVGFMPEATQMLGRNYMLRGKVVHGNQLGRTIGYPTANILPDDPDQIIPAIGIYAIKAIYNNRTYNGMLSIGYNPTVSTQNQIKIEANLFDFDEDIYGHTLEILFIEKLRDEEKFASLTDLQQQIHQDKIDAIVVLNEL